VRANVEDPSLFNFCIAIFFIAFGMLALGAGLVFVSLGALNFQPITSIHLAQQHKT
jgi:hypothetical protein